MSDNSEKTDKQHKSTKEGKTAEKDALKRNDSAETQESVDTDDKAEKLTKPDKAKNAFTITGKIFKKFRRKTSQPSTSPVPNIKVAVLGASGPTGQLLVTECLERGFDVTAVVRDPGKISTKNEKLQVVTADIFKEEELVPHFTGIDAVLSALGATGLSIFSKVTLYQTSMVAITSAMRKASVPRLVCMTSWYTEPQENSPKVFQWLVKPFIFGRVLVSMAEMERYLFTECDHINFTVVRPCMLGNGPSSGQEVKAVEGQFVPNSTGKISRHDVAKFMIECLGTEDWDNKAVAIGMPEPP